MTLAAVWIQTQEPNSQKLCFASDSRTTPGPIDGVTKVILFGRRDVAAVWAGDYRYASLILAHLDAYFTSSTAMRDRDIDLMQALNGSVLSVRRHLKSCISPMMPKFETNHHAQRPVSTSIAIGGYSFSCQQFVLMAINARDGHWDMTVGTIGDRQVRFIGDHTSQARLMARKARLQRNPRGVGWRMEPLTVIHSAIEAPQYSTIGGVPQLAKVYPHGESAAYGFIDPHTGDVWVRSIRVVGRSVRELRLNNRLIDLSQWRQKYGMYSGGKI